jgi:hypothetical protein
MGCTLKVLSEQRTVEDLWDDILSNDSQEKIMFWELRKDGTFARVVVRPDRIVAADPMEDLPYLPNREARRREDETRRISSVGMGGRVQLGQQVKKDQ